MGAENSVLLFSCFVYELLRFLGLSFLKRVNIAIVLFLCGLHCFDYIINLDLCSENFLRVFLNGLSNLIPDFLLHDFFNFPRDHLFALAH